MNEQDLPPPPPESPAPPGVVEGSAESRLFPCDNCGAELRFDIGVQRLKCPYCGHTREVAGLDAEEVEEQDFEEMIAELARRHPAGDGQEAGLREIRCQACGGTARFEGKLTSAECPYCGVTWQEAEAHEAEARIAVDGVLAFRIDHERASSNLRRWIESRWFAPREFTRRGVEGRFSGVYLPFWTFDALTENHYRGQRGEYYYVTVGTGKNKRRERRTRWYPAAGEFERFFDDVLVCAATAVPAQRVVALAPWPLAEVVPFRREFLAGFLARTYDVELARGFELAREEIDGAIRTEVAQRIGGDTQRIDSIETQYQSVTFKHLLLPVWMLAYHFHDKTYQVVVNACTGEVQGDRPYSWVKITLTVLAGLLTAGIIAWLVLGG